MNVKQMILTISAAVMPIAVINKLVFKVVPFKSKVERENFNLSMRGAAARVLPVDCSGVVQQLSVSALHLPFALGGATLPWAFFCGLVVVCVHYWLL